MKATERQRETAKEFVDQIKKKTVGFDHGIEDAVLDDWTDEGSFQACVVLKTASRRAPYKIDTSLRRLTPAIKRAAGEIENLSLTSIDHPGLVQEYDSASQKTRTRGHDNTVTVVHFFAP